MSEIEREVLPLDVLFVGAGPASLAGAYHLARLIRDHNAKGDGEPIEAAIAVLEKGKEIGSHALSGAVVDPRALQELLPDDWQDAPFEGRVDKERFLGMTSKKAYSLPIPPPLKNKGKYVASLGKLMKWLAAKVEEMEVDIFCEFPGSEALIEGDGDGARVIGVRTGDRGLDKEGEPKSNFEPGVDIHSRVVVLGEGPRGTLAKQLDQRFELSKGKNPMTYAIGLKEIWETPEQRLEPGEVIHTFGYPLDRKTYGGGFIYGMQDNQVIVGLVVGLDYRNPHLDPHTEFQRMKTNPWLADLLDGAKMTFYGAKAIPEGGYWSMPRPWGPGFLLTGDSGGFLNAQKLKGIHLAMKSGMLAAETIFDSLKARGMGEETLPSSDLRRYEDKIRQSWMHDDLYKVRNFHQAFDHGVLGGMLQTGLGMITGGRGWGIFDRLTTHAGHERMIKLTTAEGKALKKPAPVAYDNKLTFDKLADVYNSGTAHEEEQPVHLHVADPEHCVKTCIPEYDAPCQRFCPASVYEIVDEPTHDTGKRLQINASNCVHCKTCDIMDPYQIITWVPPEGGGGPSYSKM